MGPRLIGTHNSYTPAVEWKTRIWPSLGCTRRHSRRHPCGRLRFYGSLDRVLYVPAILGRWVQGLFGTYSSHTRLSVESKSRIWPSFGCCRSHKQGRPCGRLWFHGSLGPVLNVPAILGLWIQRLFGTHNSYTPCYRMKNRVYGQVWGALVPTIEGVPVADYEFKAVWTTPNCMYQPYWVRGSKGYLVHKAHISPAVELKVAYMAKFGVSSFPQTRASL